MVGQGGWRAEEREQVFSWSQSKVCGCGSKRGNKSAQGTPALSLSRALRVHRPPSNTATLRLPPHPPISSLPIHNARDATSMPDLARPPSPLPPLPPASSVSAVVLARTTRRMLWPVLLKCDHDSTKMLSKTLNIRTSERARARRHGGQSGGSSSRRSAALYQTDVHAWGRAPRASTADRPRARDKGPASPARPGPPTACPAHVASRLPAFLCRAALGPFRR